MYTGSARKDKNYLTRVSINNNVYRHAQDILIRFFTR